MRSAWSLPLSPRASPSTHLVYYDTNPTNDWDGGIGIWCSKLEWSGRLQVMADATGEVTDLLQHLIRNRCVNEATPSWGHEHRNAEVLSAYLGDTGLAIERFEPVPGRVSIVARIEGSDPTAPSLCLMGHTDVVPANESSWHRDPFGGELVDGVVWGRGAVDILNVTSSMAVAFRKLAREGFKPRGSLVYFAVADEEAAGIHGAKWITENATDAVRTDYVLTEYGGMRMSIGGGP